MVSFSYSGGLGTSNCTIPIELAPAVARAGIVRVVAAMKDPNPLVAGGGADLLRAAGVAVEVGVLSVEAEGQNRAWLTAMRERRPHVTLKAAATLDGKLADVHGTSKWITGEAARQRAHRLRAESDAIVVADGRSFREIGRASCRERVYHPV